MSDQVQLSDSATVEKDEELGALAGVFYGDLSLRNPLGSPTAEPPSVAEIEQRIQDALAEFGFTVRVNLKRGDQ